MWVMGGPMDVWDVDEHPWLLEEKAAIRRWVVDLGRPFLGLCLGHQLLADALGGRCDHQQPPEIGVLEVALTPEGLKDPIFAGMPTVQRALQWHSVKVVESPVGAVVLAASDLCPIQAMRFGRHAWSMQYHVEVEADTVSTWGDVPEYREALESTLGPTALAGLAAEAERYMDDFVANSKRLYDNFVNAVQQSG